MAETLREQGETCEFLDVLSLVSNNVSRKVEKTYVFTTRVPSVFGLLYKAGNAISTPKRKSPVYWANRLYRDKLYDYLSARSFDAVVTSHLFPAEVLTSLKRENRLSVKTLAIATDYTCIPFWEETECDYYILPHKDLVGEFLQKQMPRERLFPLGIPVSKPFRQKGDQQEARRQLGLPSQLPVFLIMTGSMGYGRIEDTIQELVNLYGNQAVIVVICGNNTKLKESLETQCQGQPNVKICGFTKKVPLYMDACDVLFTKPGGLTSTEAAVKGVSLIHTAPIPGCENKNAAFFSRRGMSYYCQEPAQQAQYARLLCENPSLRNRMAEAQRHNTNANAAEEICDLLRKAVGAEEVTSCLF